MKKALISLILALTITGCTYSLTMVNSEGQAANTVNESATDTADVAPNVTIP